MNLQDAIAELLTMSEGASPALAAELAADVAAVWSRKIAREKRDQRICDLFHTIQPADIGERFGVHRSTAYRVLHKVAEKRKLATNPV